MQLRTFLGCLTFYLSSRPIYLVIGDELDGVKRNPFEQNENNPFRNIFLSFLFEIKSPKFDFEFLSFLVFTFLGFLGYLKVIKIVTLKKCDDFGSMGVINFVVYSDFSFFGLFLLLSTVLVMFIFSFAR